MKKIIFFPVPIMVKKGRRRIRTRLVIRKIRYDSENGVSFVVADAVYGGGVAVNERYWPKEWLF